MPIATKSSNALTRAALAGLSVAMLTGGALADVRDLKPELGIRYRHAVGQSCRCGATKLYAKGQLRLGTALLAEFEGLFLILLPGQP